MEKGGFTKLEFSNTLRYTEVAPKTHGRIIGKDISLTPTGGIQFKYEKPVSAGDYTLYPVSGTIYDFSDVAGSVILDMSRINEHYPGVSAIDNSYDVVIIGILNAKWFDATLSSISSVDGDGNAFVYPYIKLSYPYSLVPTFWFISGTTVYTYPSYWTFAA